MEIDGAAQMNETQKLQRIRQLCTDNVEWHNDEAFILANYILDVLDTTNETTYPTIPVGSRVVVGMDMGDVEFGVLLKRQSHSYQVKCDGYIEPSGARHEPYDMWVTPGAVMLDPDPVATVKRDEEQWLDGYVRIEAKYDTSES